MDYIKLFDTTSKDTKPYIFSFPATSKISLDIDTSTCTKLGCFTSIDNLRAYPIMISQAINLGIPYLVIKKQDETYKLDESGIPDIGDEVDFIIDYVGSDIKDYLASFKVLIRRGVLVRTIHVILDDEEGGVELLQKAGYIVNVTHKISTLIDNLLVNKAIELYQHEKVMFYVNLKRTEFINKMDTGSNLDVRKQLTLVAEGLEADCPPILANVLRSAILSLICEKHTALCLSLDVNSWQEGRKLLQAAAPYICMVKTDVATYCDLADGDLEQFATELNLLAAKHKFFILEDSKLSGKPKECWDRTINGFWRAPSWCSFITVSGSNISDILEYWNRERSHTNLAICPIIQATYLKGQEASIFKDSSSTHWDVIAPIVITQKSLDIKHLVKLTPGILLEEHVPTGAAYRNIEDAIVRDQNHIVIMGRALFKGFDEDTYVRRVVDMAAESYRCFGLAYTSLIPKIKKQVDEVSSMKKNYEKQLSKFKKNIQQQQSNTTQEGSIFNRIASSFMKKKK